MTLFLSMEWIDGRIEFRNGSLGEDYVSVHMAAIKHLWKPDIFIENLVAYEEKKVC